MLRPFLLADYAEDYAFFPQDSSTFADSNDWIFAYVSWTSVVFFIPIAACLFWFAIKYRKPKGTPAESNVAHNTPLEVAWSVLPSFLLVAMFVFGATEYLKQRKVPEGSREVGVQAFKWGWTFDYGNGVYHPELHIVKDEPALMSMRSTDVIHSLYVPAFRAKKDIVPGRYNYMWFQPTRANPKVDDAELEKWTAEFKEADGGWDYDTAQCTPDGYTFFDLYCTEYCGTNHSEMQTAVVVHETEEELEEWIKKYSKRPDDVSQEEYGKLLYERRGCSSCHSVDGSARVGPTFQNVYASEHGLVGGERVVVDPNYIRESILYPKAKIVEGYPAVMPSYKGQLSDDDIDSIIAYLKSISENRLPGEDADPKSDEGS